MTKKDPFNELQKYLKNHPELDRLINQLEIDEEIYFETLDSLGSDIIIPKSSSSNNTYNF